MMYPPSTPHRSGVDFRSSEGLRSLLIELNAAPSGWRNTPIADDLLAYCREKYAPVARAWHRDPDDAAYEAFIAMRSPSTVKARDPWAVVTTAVALGVAAETHADRHLTSQDKARRPTKRPTSEPVRTGGYEEFFLDVYPHATTPDLTDTGVGEVVRTTTVFLVLTGWQAPPLETAVDHIASRVSDYSSRESALDIVSRDLSIAVRLGFAPTTWRALVRLLIGSRSKTTDGQLGIFARVLLGDSVSDLLGDPPLVERSRSAHPAVDETTAGVGV